MSTETATWLNQKTLHGFTDLRGHAWHYREDEQDPAYGSNHYPGAIPQEDVLERVFNFKVIKRPVFVSGIRMDGKPPKMIRDETSAGWVHSETGEHLGTTGASFTAHDYDEWLLELGAQIIGEGAQIGNVGILKRGARAWVSFEVPENRVRSGIEYRRCLLATTVFDGSMSTTYKLVQTIVVCDNTREAALNEKGTAVKVRHSRNGRLNVEDAQHALGLLVDDSQDPFAREVEALLNVTVTDSQWDAFLKAHAGPTSESKRAATTATSRMESIKKIWIDDPRVDPAWRNTAWGVLQAVNTWNQHERTVTRGADRFERNLFEVIDGRMLENDRAVYASMFRAGIALPAFAFAAKA